MPRTALLPLTVLLLALTGCAGGAASAPSGAPSPSAGVGENSDPRATWIDQGRMIALMTWGSSSCVPIVGDVTADGQRISLALEGPSEEAVCTADIAPRATLLGVPEGVDPRKETTIVATGADADTTLVLEGDGTLAGGGGQPTDYAPSAGWYGDAGLVLLTWGSSSCAPLIDRIDQTSEGATIAFREENRVCTMDMAPRGTVIPLEEAPPSPSGYTLTLIGDGLDGTVTVGG